MATDHLGIFSLTEHQNQSTVNPSLTTGPWMLNPKQQLTQAQDDDDSWEVRAFEEDTNQMMGTTWPPRFYTCTFCRREFKSAQALGGHMNVHRRDRVRLQVQPGSNTSSYHGGANSPTVIFPSQEFMANNGVCLLYTLPDVNSGGINGGTDLPPPLLSMPQFPQNNLMSYFPEFMDFPLISNSFNSGQSESSNTKPSPSINYENSQVNNGSPIDELDLELRLGRNSSMP